MRPSSPPRTCSARVGESCVERLALGAATGTSAARSRASASGASTPRVRMARRWWIPRFAVVGRLHRRTVPRGRWPIVATSGELAGLLGFAAGATALPGVERSFSSFTEAADEATVSRIYNGNHTRIDQVAGENLGRDVAQFVLRSALLRHGQQGR